MISTLASLVASTSLNVDIQTVATVSAIDLNHTTTTTIQTIQTTTISNYFYTTIDLAPNRTVVEQNDTDTPVFPSYIRNTSMVFCVVIMCLGVIGNIMVPIVIFKSKDMRNSTNIFLVNLSVADLMVLLVCTPTVLVEVNSKPETWVLGETMCKAVPFVEMTVAHASVLTILAISFERYYAICKPLKAGYVCTKTRASLICLLAWFFAAVFTSPILSIAEFKFVEYFDGTSVPACHTLANSFWSALYFLMTIFLFFIVPLVLLLIIYAVIAKNLISDAAKIVLNKHIDHYSIRARRQVVLMLGTVVLSFFLCLIPFRVFIFWIIIVPDETVNRLGVEKYYNILYFCRIMVYLNSAINPILYNLMSSKFREGFLLCSKNKKLYFKRARNGTLNTTINSYRSSTFRSQSSFRTRHQSMVVKSSNNDSPDSNRSNSSRTKIYSQPDSSKNLEPPEYARSRLDSVEIQHLDTIEQSSRSNPVSSKNGESSKNLELINYDRSRLDSVEIQHLDTAQHGTTDLKYFRSYLEPYFNRYDSRKGNSKKFVATLAETPVLFLKNESHFENISLENISSNSNGSNPLELDRTDNISSLAASDLNNFELLDESFGSNVVKLKKLKMPKRFDSLQKFDDNLYLKEMFNNKPSIESESFV